MDTSNIKSNSNMSRQQNSNDDKQSRPGVLPEGVKIVKPSASTKLLNDATAIGNYVKAETPGLLKRLCRELLLGLINTFLPGGGGSYNRPGSAPMTEYNRSGGYDYSRRSSSAGYRTPSSVFDYEDMVFEEFYQAQRVLDDMRRALADYGFVSVFDMKEFAKLYPSNPDRNYGWYHLNGVEVVTVPEGYKIDLPRAVPVRR